MSEEQGWAGLHHCIGVCRRLQGQGQEPALFASYYEGSVLLEGFGQESKVIWFLFSEDLLAARGEWRFWKAGEATRRPVWTFLQVPRLGGWGRVEWSATQENHNDS